MTCRTSKKAFPKLSLLKTAFGKCCLKVFIQQLPCAIVTLRDNFSSILANLLCSKILCSSFSAISMAIAIDRQQETTFKKQPTKVDLRSVYEY